jgi:TolB-like protein
VRLLLCGFLGTALLGVPRAAAEAQSPAAADTSRVRIVVFQFEAVPNDSAHRVLATIFSRALVRAFVADTALKVMTHPRASRDGSAAGNAQYGILGGMVEREGQVRIDLRIADIAAVQLVWRDTSSVGDTTAQSLASAALALAGRVTERLTVRRD